MTELQKDIDKCYADKNDPLACMKELVGRAKGDCLPSLVLLTQENCVPCEEEQARYQKDIDKGIIKVTSVDTPEGLDIATNNKIEGVPALILLDCHGKLILPSV